MTYFSLIQIFMILFVSLFCVQCFPASNLHEQYLEPNEEIVDHIDVGNKNETIIDFELINDEKRGLYFRIRGFRPFKKAIKYGKNLPKRLFKKIIAALVIPGTVAGLVAGTIISSAVGLKAGTFAGAAGGSLASGLESGLFNGKVHDKSEGRNLKKNKLQTIWLLIPST